MSVFEKFEEQLPNKEKFYSAITGGTIKLMNIKIIFITIKITNI